MINNQTIDKPSTDIVLTGIDDNIPALVVVRDVNDETTYVKTNLANSRDVLDLVSSVIRSTLLNTNRYKPASATELKSIQADINEAFEHAYAYDLITMEELRHVMNTEFETFCDGLTEDDCEQILQMANSGFQSVKPRKEAIEEAINDYLNGK